MEDKFLLFRRDGKGLPYGRDDVWIKELIRTDGETALAPIDDAAIEKINDNFYKALVDLSKKLGRKEFQSRMTGGMIMVTELTHTAGGNGLTGIMTE